MKTLELEEAFDERFNEYRGLFQAGAYFGAVSKLAELENCLPLLRKGSQARWRNQINKEPLSEEVLRALEAEIETATQNIRRILSFGTKWNHDELLLVWTIRIQIEMLSRFLTRRQQLSPLCFPSDDVDEAMLEVAKSKTNKRDLQIAINLIKRNWGLPISSRWLDGSFEQHGA
ncbi:MAG: hypothetical protein ABW208_21185 [Pyrinomonadaceae bacterium]